MMMLKFPNVHVNKSLLSSGLMDETNTAPLRLFCAPLLLNELLT